MSVALVTQMALDAAPDAADCVLSSTELHATKVNSKPPEISPVA